ncbi:MAG TPA: glycosyltransferase [Ramlibacter sp.]|nr:glycosyltransferase [Ramlibacter sp.]
MQPETNESDQPVPVADAALPLVSVLVRSIDRAQLREALDSVARQTYPRIEVVVVAAHPGHAPLPAAVGSHALRLLDADRTRPRSVAANAALDAARGEFLLFLDDDDWLMPDHIARLVEAVRTRPDALAAYAGVGLVDAEGKPLGQVFDLPFDAVRLLSGNLVPIHAVLFSARLRDLGCRFDEALDRYEDWDFWIQVARHTVPIHVPGISALYRIHDSSGVHADAGAASASSQRIQAKWLTQCTPQQLGDLMRRVWSHDELANRLQAAESTVLRLESALAQASAAFADQTAALQLLRAELHEQALAVERRHQHSEHLAQQLVQQLADEKARADRLAQDLADEAHRVAALTLDNAALRNSTSWRVTRPLRALAAWLGQAGTERRR